MRRIATEWPSLFPPCSESYAGFGPSAFHTVCAVPRGRSIRERVNEKLKDFVRTEAPRTPGIYAMLGPKGMPTDLVTRINQDMNQVLANEEVVKRLRDVSLFPNPRSAPQTLDFMKSEIDKWAAVIKKAGVEPL